MSKLEINKDLPKGIMVHSGKFLIPTSELIDVTKLLDKYREFFDKKFIIEEQYITLVENKTS